MVVLHNFSANVGETQSMHPSNEVAMIADSLSSATLTNVDNKADGDNSRLPYAKLIRRPNSHSFSDRKLTLDHPVKVGRSVARIRPALNNAIFDCKVLSRHHAVLWYETGKFYLKDTKSSNGTFVNNQRLSKSSEESPAQEVCSGDIVQFGVNVMENSRKITHGCIVATLKLYLPDGKEAKAGPSTLVSSTSPELYQIAQYLQEAVLREEHLENKLATLQQLLDNTKKSTDSSWKALVDEDRLLTRLESLENQLQTCAKNNTDEKLREQISELQNDKDLYQQSAKESLRKVLQDKLEAVRKHQELEGSLGNAEQECAYLRKVCDGLRSKLESLADKNRAFITEINDLDQKLRKQESEHKSLLESSEMKKNELEAVIEELKQKEANMLDELEALRNDHHLTKAMLESMKAKISNLTKQEKDEENENEIFEFESLNNSINEIEDLKLQISISQSELEESRNKVKELQERLENVQKKSNQNLNKLTTLEDQLIEYKCEDESSNQLTCQLQSQIKQLEEELEKIQDQNDRNENNPKLTITYPDESENVLIQNGTVESSECSNHELALRAEMSKLKELLAETRSDKQGCEEEISKCKGELQGAYKSIKQATEETKSIKQQLKIAEEETQRKLENVSKLQDQLSRAESSAKDFKQQISALKLRLSLEENSAKAKQAQIDRLQAKVEQDAVVLQKSSASVEELNSQLQGAHQSAKQNQNEAMLLQGKVKGLQDELSNFTSQKLEREILKGEPCENQCVNEEGPRLKSRLLEIESILSNKECENIKLKDNYKKIEESYGKLKVLKDRMESIGPNYWKTEVKNVQENYELCQKELEEKNDEILELKKAYSQVQDAETSNQQQLSFLQEKINIMSMQIQTVSLCTIVPLVILIIAIVAAFLPSISSFTATQDEPSPF